MSDTRYKVAYHIGSEEAVAADLSRYAADARKEAEAEAKNRLPNPQGELKQTKFGRTRKIVFFFSIVLLVGCVCLFVVKSVRHRSQ